MGAVPKAEMIEVNVEKLFRSRHFCSTVSHFGQTTSDTKEKRVCYIRNCHKVLDDDDALSDVSL